MRQRKRLLTSLLYSAGAFAFAELAVAITLAAEIFSPPLIALMGTVSGGNSENPHPSVDAEYYKREYSSQEDLKSHQEQLAFDIASEGMVLLEKGNIPYAKERTKLSLFSRSSADFVYGGTGSGNTTSSLDLKTAFENEGFSVNPSLWSFYRSGKGSGYKRGAGSVNYGLSSNFSINEVPLSLIESERGVVSSFQEYDTALFVLSRTGGEGSDLPRAMDDFVDSQQDENKGKHPDPEGDAKRSYLEPDSVELEVIEYLDQNFKDVILVVNANNALELGWIEDYPRISSVIQVPGIGEGGLQALPKILSGEVTPSGKLVDTYAANAFSSPAMMNMGDFEYLIDGKRIPNPKGIAWADGYHYVSYAEGIYVGYRYYETRYEDAVLGRGSAERLSPHEGGASKESGSPVWDYAQEVVYPFGYGASTTSFEWRNFSVSETADGFLASLDVANVGEVAGKDVVQLYAQTPYGDYERENGVEKSAVQLIAFQKTKILSKGEVETVTLSFSKDALKSYDRKNAKGYIMSAGQYYFTAGKDAHAAVNNILKAKGADASKMIPSPSETVPGDASLVSDFLRFNQMDATSFRSDSETGEEVTNRFSFADLASYDPSASYLSRKDWALTYPKTRGEISSIPSPHGERINGVKNGRAEGFTYVEELSEESEVYRMMIGADSLNPDAESPSFQPYEYGREIDLDLIDLRGRPYDDPLWEKLLSRMTEEEISSLVQNGGYMTRAAPSISKPLAFDKDGPAGLSRLAGLLPIGFMYPSSLALAQTWNEDLAQSKGNAVGEEGLLHGISGWYAPGANIHRTPFAGRNFEYYSEDPFLTSSIASQEVVGAAKKGVYAYVKHFALNDQETNRERHSGLATFADEQTIREIYLKTFEGIVKGDEVEETFYEVSTDEEGNVLKDSSGTPLWERKTAPIKATKGIMTSFNRIGPIWAGGSYPLVTEVLRKEWGFRGTVVTDYYHESFMDPRQVYEAGGSLLLKSTEVRFIAGEDDAMRHFMREAAKTLLYTTVHSNAMNGFVHGVKEREGWPVYRTYVILLDSVLGVVSGAFAFLSFRSAVGRKDKKKGG